MAPDILKMLRPGHPRLYVTGLADFDALGRAARAPGPRREIYENLRARADALAAMPDVGFPPSAGGLGLSRQVREDVATLAIVYRLSGEAKYARRAKEVMLDAARLPDWEPQHFLSVAEMVNALATGYDWLFDVLAPEERRTIRAGILEKGLRPGLDCYRGAANYNWWVDTVCNWSHVANGGLAAGALAIADEEPEAAAEILESGRRSVDLAMRHFDADGGWDEGPGYWGYTLQYVAYYLAALRSALGTTLGLDSTPGLAESGLFRLYHFGPTGLPASFADNSDYRRLSPAMFWLARTFRRPIYAWHERPFVQPTAMDLLWFEDGPQGPCEAGLPLVKRFRGVDIVFMRSAWEDPQALWAAFKGGDNTANHGHLDLGSFVLEALGERWAVDLGGDDYRLPGYFAANRRWTYFRLNTQSHNTLVLDGANQDRFARAPLVAFAAEGASGSAVADLSAAYPKARSVLRGLAMIDAARVLVQDEVEAAARVEVRWQMLTRAETTIEGDRAVLEQGGQRLHLRILGPAGAVFGTMGAKAPLPQAQQPDARRLVVRLPGKVESLRLAVMISTEASAAPPEVQPLREWPGWGK